MVVEGHHQVIAVAMVVVGAVLASHAILNIEVYLLLDFCISDSTLTMLINFILINQFSRDNSQTYAILMTYFLMFGPLKLWAVHVICKSLTIPILENLFDINFL